MNLLNSIKKLFELPQVRHHKKQIKVHEIELKNICKDKGDLYIGELCSIRVNIDYNDNEVYYLEIYPDKKIGNVKKCDFNFCKNYDYAFIKSFSENSIKVCIICDNVYPVSFKISTNTKFKNGTYLTINNDRTLSDPTTNVIVGNIIDKKFENIDYYNITLAFIHNEKLLTILYK